MDFIMDLSNSDSYMNMIVIIDPLLEEVLKDSLEDITSETIAKGFLGGYFPHYSLSYAIVSDCEIQFVNDFGTQIYIKLKIKKRLSIVYSPKTNGSTEYMNQEIENYLQEYMSFAQDDGLDGLDIATKAINTGDFFSTETSSFFMKHSGYLDIMNMKLGQNNTQKSSIANADHMLCKLQDIYEWI